MMKTNIAQFFLQRKITREFGKFYTHSRGVFKPNIIIIFIYVPIYTNKINSFPLFCCFICSYFYFYFLFEQLHLVNIIHNCCSDNNSWIFNYFRLKTTFFMRSIDYIKFSQTYTHQPLQSYSRTDNLQLKKLNARRSRFWKSL